MSLQPQPDAKIVFNAARDGKLYKLRTLLHKLNPEEVQNIANTRIGGATPLVMACRNGHFDVVKFLIHRCRADVEMTGSVLFDGETIEGAPPLWCAAAAGHHHVVHFLVSAGANVNSTTYTNSTPLRAACFDGHFNIVQFLVERGADVEVSNHHGHTCLMIACYKGHYHIAKYLLSLKADVNRKSGKGNTALHDCAESGNLDILKLLIENGAKMDVDAYGMTPLLAASVTGHTAIVDYIVESLGIASRLETIDALELLGATYVDKGRNMHSAYELWRKAMLMRYDSEHPMIPKPANVEPVEAYEYAKEVQTFEELLSIRGDPDAMRVQALLIRERILGPAHPDTSYYIRFRGAIYADAGRFSRCISLWNYALEMQQNMLEPLNPLTQSSLVSFTELFSLMMDADTFNNASTSRKIPIINFGDIMTVLRKCIQEVVNGAALKKPAFDEGHFQRVLIISLHLCSVLAKLLPFLSGEQEREAHVLVYSLAKLKIRGKGDRTLLHYVCTSKTGVIIRYFACQFPCAALVKMLCKTGADVNARDNDGNTPLHLIALSPVYKKEVAIVLLQNGAHLDTRNSAGLSFKDLLPGNLHKIVNEVRHTSLACLAARVIRDHRIPFEDVLPKALHTFVLQH